MKFSGIFLLLGLAWLSPTVLLAHAKLTEANPGNGAVINETPEALTLTFNEEVQLLKLALTSQDGTEVATGFTLSGAKQDVFTVSLPDLAQDAYTVSWTILGDDGHKVEEVFTFTLDANAIAKEGSVAEAPAGHSGH